LSNGLGGKEQMAGDREQGTKNERQKQESKNKEEIAEILKKAGVNPQDRPQNLDVATIIKISEAIPANSH